MLVTGNVRFWPLEKGWVDEPMGKGITFYFDKLAEYMEPGIEQYVQQIKEEIQLDRLVKSGEKGPGYVD